MFLRYKFEVSLKELVKIELLTNDSYLKWSLNKIKIYIVYYVCKEDFFS